MYLDIDSSIHKDITESTYTDFVTKQPLITWGPVERINILVGANNSGKSRFLRGLLKSNKFKVLNSLEAKLWEIQVKNIIAKCIEIFKGETNTITYTVRAGSRIQKHCRAINQDHVNLIQLLRPRGGSKSVNINVEYFQNILQQVNLFYETKGKTENFKDFVKDKRVELQIGADILNPEKTRLVQACIDTETLSTNLLSKQFSYELIENLGKLVFLLGRFKNFNIQLLQPTKKIYIPILRNANSLFERSRTDNSVKKIEQDIFKLTLENTYKIDTNEDTSIRIETGLELYKSIKKIRNNIKEVRRGFEDFEEFISKTFFNNEPVDIVAREGEKHEEDHLIIYIGGEERSIHDLGDGIQSLIILMYPIFTAPKGSWIFIEEPEINLHPGLQRIFLNQLAKNEDLISKDIKIFFTTHSNHLLDLSLEIEKGVSIFTFEKKLDDNKYCHEIKNVKNSDVDILAKLGVNNSSVFMANCSLWVEGISDRYILRAFLNAYCKQHENEKKFVEDIHYAFFEYAGSNVAHYFFSEDKELINELDQNDNIKAQFLNNRIFLLADKDAGKDKKHNTFLRQMGSNFHYYVLKCREIENLLSPIQLHKYLPQLITKLSKDVVSGIEFNLKDYQGEYLGNYLESKFPKLLPKSFKADSGTLSTYYKTKLAELVFSDIEWDEMSRDAQNLTREIYNFIKESNK